MSKKNKNKSIVLKTFNITQKKDWQTAIKKLTNPHNAKKLGNTMSSFTICTKLPINFSHVVSVVYNGVLVYDLKAGSRPKMSSVIGGGGRFQVRRNYYDNELVKVDIVFKDLIWFNKKKPVIRIVGACYERWGYLRLWF